MFTITFYCYKIVFAVGVIFALITYFNAQRVGLLLFSFFAFCKSASSQREITSQTDQYLVIIRF